MTEHDDRAIAGQGLNVLRNLLHGDPEAVPDGADCDLIRLSDIAHSVGGPIGTNFRQCVNIDIVTGALHLTRSGHALAPTPTMTTRGRCPLALRSDTRRIRSLFAGVAEKKVLQCHPLPVVSMAALQNATAALNAKA